ncbi:ATP synthase epsilon chain [Cucumis melo var. makuwa]|uniref:ATP synthase epsilon chain n=1 Tax=Cucumis melo var. makuwa TaxID=1194695 RepID=A0A5A7TMB1_CUCMM|nr:ATP synthase epsilon chain [Cucumis melo var. makuwa]
MNEIFRQTGRRIALAACIQSESKSRSRGVGQIKTNPSANPILSLAEFTNVEKMEEDSTERRGLIKLRRTKNQGPGSTSTTPGGIWMRRKSDDLPTKRGQADRTYSKNRPP